MELAHLWRRLWLRLQRKNSHRTYSVATRTRSAPERGEPLPSRYTLSRRPLSFTLFSASASTSSVRPKCLLDVDCTNLLMGGSSQYEDFSPTCWLEDHLHRFSGPSSLLHLVASTSSNMDQQNFLEPTTSSSGDASDDVQSLNSADSFGSGGGSVDFHNQMNNDNSNIISLHRYPYIDPDFSMPEPPPYEDEPPPSYEEATAGYSGLLSDDSDNTDFLW